jgi:hypothetical protein
VAKTFPARRDGALKVLNRGGFLWTAAALAMAASTSPAQPSRVTLSPDALLVDSGHSREGEVHSIGVLDTALRVYIWVPQGTSSFGLDVWDQTDEVTGASASRFTLLAPDGHEAQTLAQPQRGEWSSYEVPTGKQWGIWCLRVQGPEDAAKPAPPAVNTFRLRLRGNVEPYLRPEPGTRVRGLRLTTAGNTTAHQFYPWTPAAEPWRFTLRGYPLAGGQEVPAPQLKIPADATLPNSFAIQPDDRLGRGHSFTVQGYTPATLNEEHLAPLQIQANGTYGLGWEQEGWLFWNEHPLLPQLRRINFRSVDERGRPVPCRVDAICKQSANDPLTTYSDSKGEGQFWVLADADYTLTANAGAEFSTVCQPLAKAGQTDLRFQRVLPRPSGWYLGDTHCHTWLYDGTQSPSQVARAAGAAGLDFLAISEHAHSPNTLRPAQAFREAQSAGSGLVILPAMEYTGPQFHANVLGAILPLPAGASLDQVVSAGVAANTAANPVAVQLNHPTLGATAATLGRECAGLSMMELWNSREPEATQLWWDLLNQGRHILADTGSDSHNFKNLPLGSRQVYLHLGDQPPTPANLVRALQSGHSVLSRGAFVQFTLQGTEPGDTLSLPGDGAPLRGHIQAWGGRPLSRLRLIVNGQIQRDWALDNATVGQADVELPAVPGWYLVQAFFSGDEEPAAMTNPIWIEAKP